MSSNTKVLCSQEAGLPHVVVVVCVKDSCRWRRVHLLRRRGQRHRPKRSTLPQGQHMMKIRPRTWTPSSTQQRKQIHPQRRWGWQEDERRQRWHRPRQRLSHSQSWHQASAVLSETSENNWSNTWLLVSSEVQRSSWLLVMDAHDWSRCWFDVSELHEKGGTGGSSVFPEVPRTDVVIANSCTPPEVLHSPQILYDQTGSKKKNYWTLNVYMFVQVVAVKKLWKKCLGSTEETWRELDTSEPDERTHKGRNSSNSAPGLEPPSAVNIFVSQSYFQSELLRLGSFCDHRLNRWVTVWLRLLRWSWLWFQTFYSKVLFMALYFLCVFE